MSFLGLECQINTDNKCESFWKHLLKYPGHNLIEGLKCLEYDRNVTPMEALGNESFPQEILFEVLDMSIIQIDQEEEFGVWRYKLKFTWHDHRLKWPKTCQNSQKEENQTNLHIITSNYLKYLWNPVAIVNTFGYQFGNYGEPEIDKTITLSKVKLKKNIGS